MILPLNALPASGKLCGTCSLSCFHLSVLHGSFFLNSCPGYWCRSHCMNSFQIYATGIQISSPQNSPIFREVFWSLHPSNSFLCSSSPAHSLLMGEWIFVVPEYGQTSKHTAVERSQTSLLSRASPCLWSIYLQSFAQLPAFCPILLARLVYSGTHRSCQTKHSRLIPLSSSLFLETFN